MSEAISLRLSKELLNKLSWEAAEKGIKLSELIREKIEASYDEKDSKIIVEAVKGKMSEMNSDLSNIKKFLVNVSNFLKEFQKEKQESEALNQEWHVKNNEGLSSLKGKIIYEFVALTGLIDRQKNLIEELRPKQILSAKFTWLDTLNNLCQTPVFYFFHWLFMVILITAGLAFHFTGEHWLGVFSSLNNFWQIFRFNMNIFVYVFFILIVTYPFLIHVVLKHLTKSGWRCDMKVIKQ